MVKAATILALVGICSSARADWPEGFESFPYTGIPDSFTFVEFANRGWFQSNQSEPVGSQTSWHIIGGPVHGGTHSAMMSFFASSLDDGVISFWLETPTQAFHNGDTFSFWTICPDNQSNIFVPGDDDLEVRLSTAGDSTNTGTTATDVGDFQTVLLDINPGNMTDGYPGVWTQYTMTISGLSGPASGRLALRYIAPNSSFVNFIVIDDLDYTSSCAADFNHDGIANSQDFFDFLTAFFASDPAADFNGDGTINSQDYFDFLTAFFAGCP